MNPQHVQWAEEKAEKIFHDHVVAYAEDGGKPAIVQALLEAIERGRAGERERCAGIAGDLAMEAFKYEKRNEANQPGSLSIPENAYNMATLIGRLIAEPMRGIERLAPSSGGENGG